jgi:hypothetical protein
MRSLLHLPNELLLLVIHDLPHKLDVECVARTFNKRLYALCVPLLEERIAYVKNSKRVVDVFTSRGVRIIAATGYEFNFCFYKNSGINRQSWGPLALPAAVDYTHPIGSIDFLDLQGDFYWLQPTNYDHDAEEDEEERITVGLARLQAQAMELDLSLPATFMQFMGSQNLRSRMPFADGSQWRFTIGPLQTVHARTANWRPFTGVAEYTNVPGAYVVEFLFNYDDCMSWHLYLDRSGMHCVLTGGAQHGSRATNMLFTVIGPHNPGDAELHNRWWMKNVWA